MLLMSPLHYVSRRSGRWVPLMSAEPGLALSAVMICARCIQHRIFAHHIVFLNLFALPGLAQIFSFRGRSNSFRNY
jgi:hypothetical protein